MNAPAPIATTAAVDLAEALLAALPATRTPDPGLPTAAGWNQGIGSVRVMALDAPEGGPPLWLAHSQGYRHRDQQGRQDHFVALYGRGEDGDSWRLVDRVELSCPDRLDGVGQVTVAPERLWILAQGRANAHESCFDLLSFDGHALRHEIAHAAAGPDRSRLEDLDADGILDVVLDISDPYVLCYACGIRLEAFDLRRWDGERFVPVRLEPLAAGVPGSVREPINQAVSSARAGLWKDAAIQVRRAGAELPDYPAAVWDVALIELHAAARARHARESGYPLLAHVFHGDYPAAVALMRRHRAEALFSSEPPLIAGTPARTWEASLVGRIERSATAAIAEHPDLAAAYFVRGWARHVGNPIDGNAVRDVQRAADFAPDDDLFAESAATLAIERRFLNAVRVRRGGS